MQIEIAEIVSDELVESVKRLVPYLGTHKPIPTSNDIALLLKSSSVLLIVRYPDRASTIVGMLSLSIYRVPTGVRSIIEDVVVDPDFRGLGLAKGMLEEAIRIAEDRGADHISLTSNSFRVEANHLYNKMGFHLRETNVYMYPLKKR